MTPRPAPLLALLLGVLFGACSPGQEPEAARPTPTPSPAPARQPLSEARIEGVYAVRLFVTQNTYDSKPAPDQEWRFDPGCAEGACDVTLLGNMRFTTGGELRQEGGAENRFRLRLAQLGGRYGGVVSAFFGACGEEPKRERWTFNLKVGGARYVDGSWTAIRWSGTWTRVSPFDPLCGTARLRAVIRGTLPT